MIHIWFLQSLNLEKPSSTLIGAQKWMFSFPIIAGNTHDLLGIHLIDKRPEKKERQRILIQDCYRI